MELKSKSDLKNLTLSNGSHDRVLLEGGIGKLQQATFIEDTILEVVGKKGTLRINLKQSELKKQEAKTNGTT